MAIVFHCEHCGKKIEAQEGAAGKWAKCPSCQNKIYVPDLTSGEELKLAPIDETEEAKQKRLMAETYKLTLDILREKEVPNGQLPSAPAPPPLSNDELTEAVIKYLRQMADGELDAANDTETLIIPFGRRALEILDRLAVSDMREPELADIPPQVLSGLIKNLRAKLP